MIEVSKNSIKISNVDKGSAEYKILRNKFSVYDNVTHQYSFSAYTEVGDDIFIPKSVGINEITSIFKKKKVVDVSDGTVSKSKKVQFQMVDKPRDELQEKAISIVLNAKKTNDSFFLSLATGAGKTFIVTHLSSVLKKRTMIIVDTISLAEQWQKEFLKHTTLKESQIAILSGKDSIEKEMKQANKSVYIAIHRTLGNLLEEDFDYINKLNNKLGIGFRVFDESHVEFKNICLINSFSNVDFTVYLTATPGRSKFTDNSLYSKVFGKIPFFNGKGDSAIGNYHTVVLTQFKSTPGIEDKIKIKTKYGFSSSRWANYIYEKDYEVFADAIIKIIKTLKLTQRKTFIMLPTINLIKKLKTDLEEEFGISVGTFIGEIKKESDRENELSKQLVLTNDKIFDKGIDVSDLDVLINCVQLSSQIKLEQIIGRLRYKKGKEQVLIDLADFGYDETIKNFKLRKRLYKKKAKKIIEIN